MDGRKGFKKAGWKVNEGYKQIVAVSPEGKEYFIIQKGESLPSLKKQGKTFGDVITDAYNAAVKQGLIKVNEAESFHAEGGDSKKTTSTLYARFYVGHDKDGELKGNGKFKKYNDAVAKAKEVEKKEGNSRVVSTRGFALWTHDGKGLFQAGKSTSEAKEFYRAEDDGVNMNAYAQDYLAAEDEFFESNLGIADGFKLGFGGALGLTAFGIGIGIITNLLNNKEE